jgi:hypothetical protein
VCSSDSASRSQSSSSTSSVLRSEEIQAVGPKLASRVNATAVIQQLETPRFHVINHWDAICKLRDHFLWDIAQFHESIPNGVLTTSNQNALVLAGPPWEASLRQIRNGALHT